jgi:hypothetical protein
MTTFNLYPLNDFAVRVTLKDIDTTPGSPTFGKSIPLTSGSVTAFLATSNAPTAAAADPSLTMSPTHIANGVWLVSFDAAVLTAALLATLFAATLPFLIVQKPSGVRVYYDVVYQASRQGTIT